MDFQTKLQQCRDAIYEKVSTKNITLLKDFEISQELRFNKNGKYYYNIINRSHELNNKHIYRFLEQLVDKKVYVIIPLLSVNNTPEEPYVILSKQILVSNNSNEKLITDYLNERIKLFFDLYFLGEPEQMYVTFKYKEIEFNYKQNKIK